MFIIKPKTKSDMAEALLILSYYRVKIKVTSDGETQKSMYLIVDEETLEGQLQMAEMAFQFNFHQANERLCEECRIEVSKKGVGLSTCGHLTFSSSINRNIKWINK